MTDYSKMELMICVASRVLENGRIVAVGTGAPCAASMLAQKTHAPDLVLFFEAGGFAPLLPSMPISVGDSRTFHKGLMASNMFDTMTAGARGFMDYCFLGGAQIDPFGNLNSTIIGANHQQPNVRFPGSGGANDFASFAWRTIVMMPHGKKRFVETLDFLTTPGYLTGKGAREAAGLPANTGPFKVITNMAVLGYDAETCRMTLESLHPGVTLEALREETGFELGIPADVPETPPPTDDELQILRTEVDPHRYVIGRA